MRKTFDPAEVDPNRLQAVIDDSFKSKSFADFKTRIAKAAKVLLPASYVLEELLIKSLSGGDDQEQHFDFEKSCVEHYAKSGR